MFEGRKIAVVMPAHNEAAHIIKSITDVPFWVDLVVVVDDASTDSTPDVVESVVDSRIRLVHLARNLGVGGAIIIGHRIALHEEADLIAVMAGDGQMDPDKLMLLLRPLIDDDCDYAKGNRFFGRGSYEGMPRTRVFGNVLLSFLNKYASGYYNIFDSQNGYTAIQRRSLLQLPLDDLASRYSFENDILIHLNMLRAQVQDVAIPARYGLEKSGIQLGNVGLEIVLTMFRGGLKRVWFKYFYWSFGLFASLMILALLAFSLFVVLSLFSLPTVIGAESLGGGTVTVLIALFMVGFVAILFSLVLDVLDCPGRPVRVTLNSVEVVRREKK